MLNSSTVIFIILSVAYLVEGHVIIKRSWFSKKKTTTEATTTERIVTTEAPLEFNPIELAISQLPPEIAQRFLEEATTEDFISTTTESSGFFGFLRNGLKNVPILGVVQDTLVSTVDKVVDLPGNLVEGIKSGNPLNVVESVVKALPLIDESVVEKGFDVVEEGIVNLPSTVVEGVKKGADFLNATTSTVGGAVAGVISPLTDVVATGLEKGAHVLNTTGSVLGKVLDPVSYLGVGLVNTTLQGTGDLVEKTTGGVVDLLSGVVSALGIPLIIVIVIIVIVIVIVIVWACCRWVCKCKCTGKENKSDAPYTPGKNSDAEDAQRLLPQNE